MDILSQYSRTITFSQAYNPSFTNMANDFGKHAAQQLNTAVRGAMQVQKISYEWAGVKNHKMVHCHTGRGNCGKGKTKMLCNVRYRNDKLRAPDNKKPRCSTCMSLFVLANV